MLETETPHVIETEAAQPKFDFSLSRPAELELRIRDGDAGVNICMDVCGGHGQGDRP